MSLLDITFPPLANMFYSGAVPIANMDLIDAEGIYEELFDFFPTIPINEKYDAFGIGNKNFMLNSGAYLIFVLCILLEFAFL